MKSIEKISNVKVLLPQNIGDNIKWYGFMVYYDNINEITEDDVLRHGTMHEKSGIPHYRHILATGQVGYDVLPSIGINRPTLIGGQSGKNEASRYLLDVLNIKDEDIFTIDELVKGFTVSCVIAKHTTNTTK
jgi:hypothetical protein